MPPPPSPHWERSSHLDKARCELEGMGARPVPSAGLMVSFYFRPRANSKRCRLGRHPGWLCVSGRMAAGSSAQLSGCLQEGSRNSAGAQTSYSGCFAGLLVCKSCFCKPRGTCHGPKPNLFFWFWVCRRSFNVNSRSLTSRGTLPRLGWVVSHLVSYAV